MPVLVAKYPCGNTPTCSYCGADTDFACSTYEEVEKAVLRGQSSCEIAMRNALDDHRPEVFNVLRELSSMSLAELEEVKYAVDFRIRNY
jgi:hypothetical protein